MFSFIEFLNEAKATQAEEAQMSSLRNQHSELKKKHPNGVPMDLGDSEIHHVTSIAKVKGYPKADAIFHTSDPKVKKYASLKSSNDPKRYRQYGGVSRSKDMKENPVVKQFAKHLSKTVHDETSPRHSATLNRENPHHNRLLHQAIFGHDYGKKHGPNNVDVIHHGDTHIVPHPKVPGAYKLTSKTAYKNGELPKSVGGEIVRENSEKQNDLGINKSRVFISPIGHNKIEDITDKVNKTK